MDRSEKRRQEREEKHEQKFIDRNVVWYDNLSPDKKEFVRRVALAKIQSNDRITAAIMDSCLMSAVDDIVGVEAVRVKKIIDISNEYMLEYKDFLDKYGDGGINMIEKAKCEVNDKIRQYIKGKMQKNKAIKLLKKEFNIPDAELSNMWICCKAENTTEEKSIKNALEYEKKGNDIKDMDKEEPKLKSNSELVDAEFKTGPQTNSKLKIVNIIREIHGEYGVYIVSNKGVKINGKHFDNLDIVNKNRVTLKNDYEKNKAFIKEQMDELNKQLKNIDIAYDTKLKKYDELEEVFNS